MQDKTVEQHAAAEQKPVVDQKTTATSEHIDNKEPDLAGILLSEKVAIENEEHLDRFGAWEKSNPIEKALVKKLDWYMMVSFESLRQ